MRSSGFRAVAISTDGNLQSGFLRFNEIGWEQETGYPIGRNEIPIEIGMRFDEIRWDLDLKLTRAGRACPISCLHDARRGPCNEDAA